MPWFPLLIVFIRWSSGHYWCRWQCVGAVAAGFLLKGMFDIQSCLMILGGLVVIAASFVLMIRFSVEHKEKEQLLFEQGF